MQIYNMYEAKAIIKIHPMKKTGWLNSTRPLKKN
jgi:hypothetical protein